MSAADALNGWLAVEHEAVWLYPVIGARFADLRPRATRSFEMHRDTRDALLGRLQLLGVDPVSTELSYETGPLTNENQARKAAQAVEARICAACLQLAGEATSDLRTSAVKNLKKAALAEQTWGASPKAFPGLP
ncbi:DUF4439 domain-containing protein [Aeromicrobium sp. P5_D10]